MSLLIRPRSRLLGFEALERRDVPSAYLETDAPGDFLPEYVGAQDPGLDVLSYEAVLIDDRLVISGEMAGSVADTQVNNGLYLTGIDRGQGTPRFLANTPIIGPNVTWDLIVRVNPNGTGLVNNQIAGITTPLNPADITISGNTFTARVPLDLLMPSSTLPPEEWTYNLWPRGGGVPGQNQFVSDLAPDDGNMPVRVVAPVRVANVAVNDGAAQRSMVNSLTVTFDGSVSLGANAFELTGPTGTVELSIDASEVDGQTVAVLTFAGTGVIGGSLADGNYSLLIRADQVHDRWGRELDGDADSAAGGNATDGFHRLFGDSDGDRDVDLTDLVRFLSSLGKKEGDAGYHWYFDVNGDDRVGVVDVVAFARRLGSHLNP